MELVTSPPLQKVLLREPSLLFRILPSYAVVGRVVPAFWCRFHLAPVRGRRSDPSSLGEALVISSLFLFSPMLFLFRLMLSRVRPAPLSVEQAAVQRPNLVFGRSKSS